MRRNPLVPTFKVELFIKGKPVKTVLAFDALGGYNFTKLFEDGGDSIDTRNPAIVIRCFADPPIPDDISDREILQGVPLTVAAEISKKAAEFLAPKDDVEADVNPPAAEVRLASPIVVSRKGKRGRRAITNSKPSPASTSAGTPNVSGKATSPVVN